MTREEFNRFKELVKRFENDKHLRDAAKVRNLLHVDGRILTDEEKKDMRVKSDLLFTDPIAWPRG